MVMRPEGLEAVAGNVWRAAVEGSGLGMWEWLFPDGPAYFSPRCAEMLGYRSVPSLNGIGDWLSLVHPEDRRRARRDLMGALRGDARVHSSEHRLKCQDGTWKWVLVRGSAIAKCGGGRSLHMVGTIADTSERHLYISALRRAEQSSRRTLEDLRSYLAAINQHALVSVTDVHGIILEINPKFCEVSGYSQQELVGSNHRILNSGRHPASFFEAMWRTITEGRIWRGEICNQAKDGHQYWVDSAIVPQLDSNGLPVRYISVRVEITERKANEQRIEYLATHDLLTGLPNRNLLQDRVQQAIARARRRNKKFAVLFIDLDGFKDINDTQRHDAGDVLLQQVARRWKTLIRAEDTLGRLGGDEFVALLTDLETGEEAARIAEKLLHSLSFPFKLAGKDIHVGASIGLAVFPNDGEDADALFKHCDIAMYQVKESGRNGYQFFAPAMQQRVTERQELRQILHDALHSGQLTLEYQPIQSLPHWETAALDVHVTWQNPKQGTLKRGDLLQIAEEFGLAAELGAWVATAACQQLRDWQDAGARVIPRLLVNLPSRHAEQAHVLETLNVVIRELDIEPERLAFGIPDFGVGWAPRALPLLEEVASAGFGLYINGFGSSHCNLASLRQLPLVAIRLDRSLMGFVAEGPQLRAVLKAMIELIHAIGFRVVAEGVDTPVQKKILCELDCDAIQGESAYRPLRAAEVKREILDAR